jgi:hypothetical protein
MSFGCADDAYEPPYFSRSHLPYPSPAMRLALVGAQLIVYHQRFELSARCVGPVAGGLWLEACGWGPVAAA